MKHVGFIGLGIMGSPMCRHILDAGYTVTVYNRSSNKMAPLVQAGAHQASSPVEVALQSDVVITMVSDSPDVDEVILGENGVIHGGKPGTVVVDMSTISPAVTRKITEKLHQKNMDMLDAPVSGGDIGAKAGTLSIMAGGEWAVFNQIKPLLETMGKATYVGTHGMGQTVKLCNQILVSVTNMAVCEALLLARKSGVDPSGMIEATSKGAAASWQLSNLGPKMIERDFNPGFMIDLQQKDLKIAIETARELHLPLPALNLVSQLFAGCQANHEGKNGTQALIKSLERLAGLSV